MPPMLAAPSLRGKQLGGLGCRGPGSLPMDPQQAENGHNSLHLGSTHSGTPRCGHKTSSTPLILNHGGFAPKSPPWGRTYIHQQKWGKPRGILPLSKLEGVAQGKVERDDLGGRAGDPQGCGVAGQCRGPAGCQLPALSPGLTSGIKPGATGGDAGTRLHPAPARGWGEHSATSPRDLGFL